MLKCVNLSSLSLMSFIDIAVVHVIIGFMIMFHAYLMFMVSLVYETELNHSQGVWRASVRVPA